MIDFKGFSVFTDRNNIKADIYIQIVLNYIFVDSLNKQLYFFGLYKFLR